MFIGNSVSFMRYCALTFKSASSWPENALCCETVQHVPCGDGDDQILYHQFIRDFAVTMAEVCFNMLDSACIFADKGKSLDFLCEHKLILQRCKCPKCGSDLQN